LHDLDVPALFETAWDRLDHTSSLWSRKILFGTDYSFLSVQAADVILYLLSHEFTGALADAQRILGGNALHIIQKPFRRKTDSGQQPAEIFSHDKSRNVQGEIENSIVTKIGTGDWNLASLDFMLPPMNTWPRVEAMNEGGFNGVYLDSYILTLESKDASTEYHLWIRRRAGGLLSCSLISTQGSVVIESLEFASQKMGGILSQVLANNSQLAKNENELSSLLKSVIG
jgi:hypothetical protein